MLNWNSLIIKALQNLNIIHLSLPKTTQPWNSLRTSHIIYDSAYLEKIYPPSQVISGDPTCPFISLWNPLYMRTIRIRDKYLAWPGGYFVLQSLKAFQHTYLLFYNHRYNEKLMNITYLWLLSNIIILHALVTQPLKNTVRTL